MKLNLLEKNRFYLSINKMPRSKSRDKKLSKPSLPKQKRSINKAKTKKDTTFENCRPKDIMKALVDGNKRFKKAWKLADVGTSIQRKKIFSDIWKSNCFVSPHILEKRQNPWAAILTCSDSRMSPEWIFNCSFSDLFVVRTIGAISSPSVIASLEYAVAILGINTIIVLGHSNSDVISNITGNLDKMPQSIVKNIAPEIKKGIKGVQQGDLIQYGQMNAYNTVKTILKDSNLLQDAYTKKRIDIRAAYFNLESGEVSFLYPYIHNEKERSDIDIKAPEQTYYSQPTEEVYYQEPDYGEEQYDYQY